VLVPIKVGQAMWCKTVEGMPGELRGRTLARGEDSEEED